MRRKTLVDPVTGGTYSRHVNDVLFVCYGNVARSATAEHLARLKRNGDRAIYADSAGTLKRANRPLTLECIERAELIVCMEETHAQEVMRLAPHRKEDIRVWHIPDDYTYYCQPQLITLLSPLLDACLAEIQAGSMR